MTAASLKALVWRGIDFRDVARRHLLTKEAS